MQRAVAAMAKLFIVTFLLGTKVSGTAADLHTQAKLEMHSEMKSNQDTQNNAINVEKNQKPPSTQYLF